MRLLHSSGVVRASFDDANLVSYAGLEPVMRLAESCDLQGIVGERLHLPTHKGSNASGKVSTIVAGMLTGADSIDDLDVVRHGGMAGLFAGVRQGSVDEFGEDLLDDHRSRAEAGGVPRCAGRR